MSSKKTAIAVLFSLTPSIASAFEGDDLVALYDEEELITIATGTEKQVRFAPSVTSVISQDDIKRVGAKTLDEALEMVPGLHVSNQFNRLASVYSIRGIHTTENPQVLLLLNGERLSTISNGGRPFGYRMPVEDIYRIEVIRGPGSAVYGADAFSGVINVVTKTSEGLDKLTVGARAGSFDSQDYWIQGGKNFGGFQLSASLEYSTSDGDDSRTWDTDFQTVADDLFATSASLAPGALDTRYEIINFNGKVKRDSWYLSLYSWHQLDGGNGPGGSLALDNDGYTEVEYWRASTGIESVEIADALNMSARFSYVKQDLESRFVLFPQGAVLPIDAMGNVNAVSPAGFVLFPDGLIGEPGGKEQTYEFGTVFTYSGFDAHNLRLALGYEEQDVEATEKKNFGPGVIDGTSLVFPGPNPPVSGALTNVSGTQFVYLPDSNREIYYLSIQDEWQLASDWELTAGLRYDHYTEFGETYNPRLALVWAADYNLTVKALYGRAFRAPTFAELFAINNPSVIGNKNLDPETIDTLELAFDYVITPELRNKLNLYVYQVKDLIDFSAGVPAGNNADQDGYGFEYDVEWKPDSAFELRANYSWQRSTDDMTNERVPNAPQQQVYLDFLYRPLNSLFIGTQVNWVLDRERAASDIRGKIDDFVWVDLTARWSLEEYNSEIAVSIRNLFDEDAAEPSDPYALPDPRQQDFPLEERSIRLEFRTDI